MATQAYQNWVKAGEPYQLAEWMNDLVNTMRGHGFTVYHYPDIAHLTTSQPQDHTPFSYTGWPIDSPFGWAFGVDIMPKSGTDARALAPLARQIIADKDAGHPGLAGLKYINWTDEQGNVWQTSWKPNKATRSNTDKGHIHLSGRSDSAHWRATGYDPIARMTGEGMLTPEEIVNSVVNGSTNAGYIPGREGASPIWPAGLYSLRVLHAKMDMMTTALARLESRLAESGVREAATLAAISALTQNGGPDAAPIIARIDEVATTLGREISDLESRLDAATGRAEAAERERDRLLSEAYAASSAP